MGIDYHWKSSSITGLQLTGGTSIISDEEVYAMSFDDSATPTANVTPPTGVYSGILKAGAAIIGGYPNPKFSLFWRPTMLSAQESDKGRWLPVYADVETTAGADPSISAIQDLSLPTTGQKIMYFYLVRPDYPQATPVPKMGTISQDEIEFKAVIAVESDPGSGSAAVTGSIDLGFEVLT